MTRSTADNGLMVLGSLFLSLTACWESSDSAYDRGYDQRPNVDTQTFDNMFDAVCNAMEEHRV